MSATIRTTTERPTLFAGYPVRTVGFWLAVALIAYMFFNAFRAFTDPVGFAITFGTPLQATGETAFVAVYGIRALFLAVFGLVLLATRNFKGLATFVLVGVVMPVGDALLVASSGSGASIVLRHVMVAALLLVAWWFMRRTAAALAR